MNFTLDLGDVQTEPYKGHNSQPCTTRGSQSHATSPQKWGKNGVFLRDCVDSTVAKQIFCTKNR